ncbi:hypothetical protein B7463_g11765, partial [Scytalidium lignicola]
MEAYNLPPGPGKTAPRLIADLLEYDPRYLRKNGKNLLVDPAPKFTGRTLPPRQGPSDCRHQLMRGLRTHTPTSPDARADGSPKYVAATYCTNCRYRFDVTVDYTLRPDRTESCNLASAFNPMHHLRLSQSMNRREQKELYGEDKYNVITEAHQFICTSPTCPVIVEVKICPPRLSNEMLKLVIDPAKVDSRSRKIIESEPERFEGMEALRPLNILDYLRRYIFDAVHKGPNEKKRISSRNKKFALAFADECDDLLHYLGFNDSVDEGPNPEDVPECAWQLPEVTESNREFYEDILTELSVIISSRPEREKEASGVRIAFMATPALRDIELSLGYFDYPTKSRTVDVDLIEHPYYASLGSLDNFTDDLIRWAYERQCECDPANKPYYLDCLADLANGRESSDLQERVAMAKSIGEYSLKDIEEAYRFFNLDSKAIEVDDHIMGVYKSRIESAPRQKDEAKANLLIIGKARNSAKIEALANDRSMTFEEALEFLGVAADTPSDSIEAVAVAMADEADKSRVARALRVISRQRGNDFTLQRAATSLESGSGQPTLDIGEAYNRLQISERNAPDETVLAYYQSLSSGAPAGSKESYTEALRVIAMDRQSNFLLVKLDDPNANVESISVPADQPIGLDNIGNTCYLNSLLQYYYTVKAVRDVVIDFDQHRMSLNDEDIKKKRVGGRAVAKPEIIKAQKFVEELRNLFESLKTASSRSVKPTRELAELTIFSSAAEANFRRASISSPGPPNLAQILNSPLSTVYGPEGPPPSVPSRPSPIPVEDKKDEKDDIEMIDRPIENNVDDDDTSSEATLVDMDQLPPYNEVIKQDREMAVRGRSMSNAVLETGSTIIPIEQEKAPEDSSAFEEDPAAANKDENSLNTEVVYAPPDKPPPVPPRNKSGLVIQTNDSRDLIADDELWKFGSQQDVTEVIGNVMFRLQCAIQPTSIDEATGEQIDSVRDTFFGANAVYLQKAQKLERKVEPWANLIVFPPVTGSRDIYEALDVVFDEQIVEIDNTYIPQRSSISKLPPILQIQIQRTAYDPVKQTAWKNRNPVTFPETIYLDRYMDSEEPDSALMQRRKETWNWKNKLKNLETRRAALLTTETPLTVPEALAATKDFISALQEEEIEGVEVDPSLNDSLEQRIAEVNQELADIELEMTQLNRKLNEQFTSMRQYEYKLQTVFIHRGEAGGGHYWIYVYDFEHDVWREYNDEYVTVVKDRRRIFDNQPSGGTPYYLAYVRNQDKNELVNAVSREVHEVQMTDVTQGWSEQMDMDEGIGMDMDGEEEKRSDIKHVENIKPRELRPMPPLVGPTGTKPWQPGEIIDLDAWNQQ